MHGEPVKASRLLLRFWQLERPSEVRCHPSPLLSILQVTTLLSLSGLTLFPCAAPQACQAARGKQGKSRCPGSYTAMLETSTDQEVPTWHSLPQVKSFSKIWSLHTQSFDSLQLMFIKSLVPCRKLLKEVLLLAESEQAEVSEEIAELYTESLLKPLEVGITISVERS